MPRHTPFHARTNALCTSQDWQEWSGYLAANSYALDHMREYNAVRTSCGLFDISPLYKYHVRGRDAQRLLDRVVTRDLAKCRVGQVMYTAWCDDDGKIIDDGTVARLGDDFFRLTAAIPTLDWLEDNAFGMTVEVEDVTDAYGGLSLQGPTSRDLLQQLSGSDLGGLRYFRLIEDKIAGVPARISRTGYTGDLGYEIFVAPGDAETLWDALSATGRAYNLQPAGNTALDMARIEAGLLLIDVDFVSAAKTLFAVQKNSPYELGLDWMVKLGKHHFIGREALRREHERGPAWTTVGLSLDILALEKVYAGYDMPLHLPYTSWNSAVPVYADSDQRDAIGKATSGTWSPVLKQYVVIARVESRYGAHGTRIFVEETVEGRRFAVPAEVVPMPFFDPPRKKA
jgi:aminomethyltransferase